MRHASTTWTLALSAYPVHPQQGYHVKLTVNADGSQGADTKHKVFWVGPCDPGTPTVNPPTESAIESAEQPTRLVALLGGTPPRGGTAGSAGGPPVVTLPDTAMSVASTSGLLLAGLVLLSGSTLVAVKVRAAARAADAPMGGRRCPPIPRAERTLGPRGPGVTVVSAVRPMNEACTAWAADAADASGTSAHTTRRPPSSNEPSPWAGSGSTSGVRAAGPTRLMRAMRSLRSTASMRTPSSSRRRGPHHRLRRLVVERPHHEVQPAAARAAHGHRVDDLGAHLGQQLELEGVDGRQEAGGRHEVRIGLEHAADVLEQLAAERRAARPPAPPPTGRCRRGRAW